MFPCRSHLSPSLALISVTRYNTFTVTFTSYSILMTKIPNCVHLSFQKTSESKSPSGKYKMFLNMISCSMYMLPTLTCEHVSVGTGFLFEQTDKCEDFQFSFASKSPQTSTADQDKTSRDDFPFSFNFGKF